MANECSAWGEGKDSEAVPQSENRPIEENLTQVSDIHWFKEFIELYDPDQPTGEIDLGDKIIEELKIADQGERARGARQYWFLFD
ncbi:hypothetical protein F7C95_15515 [Opitutia bacterium ISCC 51]|nr:hypothetical protein F7C95_15515 [Opitutae bacterium ISCC 51]QXD27393.1 hypothetical protein GA003_15415 [Opitutae bacterium ISCC 52]